MKLIKTKDQTPNERGEVACHREGLTAAQRMELARESTPRWRGVIAHLAPGLTAEQRMELKIEEEKK